MIKTGQELAEMAERISKEKTIYVMGCFGAPMTQMNQERYIQHHSFNRREERLRAIHQADAHTYGFDCVGLIKGILWGWTGETPSYYGGGEYAANEVPDLDANRMLDICREVSGDFSRVLPGEVLGMEDHIGIYLGEGKAAECTHRWKDGVQITAVHNIGRIPGVPGRSWVRHGRLPWIHYNQLPEPEDSGIKNFIREVQAATGSVADGVAGEQTLRNTVTVSRWVNDRHPVVKILQKRLYALGYTEVGQADGVTGPRFYDGLVRFQQEHGCYADGIITARNKTWRKLLEME